MDGKVYKKLYFKVRKIKQSCWSCLDVEWLDWTQESTLKCSEDSLCRSFVLQRQGACSQRQLKQKSDSCGVEWDRATASLGTSTETSQQIDRLRQDLALILRPKSFRKHLKTPWISEKSEKIITSWMAEQEIREEFCWVMAAMDEVGSHPSPWSTAWVATNSSSRLQAWTRWKKTGTL